MEDSVGSVLDLMPRSQHSRVHAQALHDLRRILALLPARAQQGVDARVALCRDEPRRIDCGCRAGDGPLGLIALPLAGYFFAWVAHFGVEKNRPATFTYPLWSLAADFKMWAMWLTGRLGPELDKAGVRR